MSRIHYARQKHLLTLLHKDPKIELQIVVGGSVLLEKYGDKFLPAIEGSGLQIRETLFNVIDGGNHIAMAKTAGLTVLEFANSLYKLNPDVVLIRGDRFEQLAMAMAAAYLNKTIAHIEGGDLSGTIDESVRHAITKLAHLHFTTNEDSRRRVVKMGEHPRRVWNVGSLDVEFASSVNKKLDKQLIYESGIGAHIDAGKPFLMVMQHPVTTEKSNRRHMELLLRVVDGLDMQAVWFWPNSDAGTDEMAKAIRMYREHGELKHNKIKFITHILPEDFIALLKCAKVLVGNSSAGIKECSYLGVPVVNVGTRQKNRLRASNVTDVEPRAAAIKRAIEKQLSHGPYSSSRIYYKLGTSKKIADVLGKVKLYVQKEFYET